MTGLAIEVRGDGDWRKSTAAQSLGRVLVVDDDPQVRRALARTLGAAGLEVLDACDAPSALKQLASSPDVVVSDIAMPGVSGLDLLTAIRQRDLDLPVLFLTGVASDDHVDRATRQGAFRVLQKPVGPEELLAVVRDALQIRQLARVRPNAERHDDRVDAFHEALAGIRMFYQPVVSAATRETIGWEALLRSSSKTLGSPLALLEAAEELHAMQLLARTVRSSIAADLDTMAPEGLVFVNLHASDLADPVLFHSDPLLAHAQRVVLELTERATLEGIADLSERIDRLRTSGFRLAVDDLGAGYSGMSSFAWVRPEIVKIDMSLVRGVDQDRVKQHVVRSLIDLAHALSMQVVTEGVETPAERDTCVALGTDYLQGYLLGRPAPGFALAVWR